jgi:hypothetical protein
VKNRSLISGFLESVLLWTDSSYFPSEVQLKVLTEITRTPQALIFKMTLIHISGVLQTAPLNGIHDTFKMFSVTLAIRMLLLSYWPNFPEF